MPDPDYAPDPARAQGPKNVPGVGAVQVTTNMGGTVVVASDAMLHQLDSLASLSGQLRRLAGELSEIMQKFEPRSSLYYDVPPAALEARRLSHAAHQLLLTGSDHSSRMRTSVRMTMVEYARIDHAVKGLGHGADEAVAGVFGAGFRLFGLPIAFLAVGGVLAGAAITGRSPLTLALTAQAFLKHHGRILTSESSVRAIRSMAASADGFGEGFLLMPPGIASMLQRTGLTGVSSSSRTVVAIGRTVGLFAPTTAQVRKTSSFEYGSVPTSLVDRSKSFPIPETDPNGEQIRIDRYVEAGKADRYDVFIAGTVTFDPVTGTQPFDLQSDLQGVGRGPSASYDSVAAAMKQAGVTAASPVVLNGFSQGGLLASQLAASGDYNVRGVVTFGAPSDQVQLPASIPVLSVRNAEDLVPSTSGYDVNPNAVVVTVPVFAHQAIPSEFAVPAHEIDEYQKSSAAIDQSTSSEVRGVLDPLNQFGAGATRVDSTLWVATRVSPDQVSTGTYCAPEGGETRAR
jgi:hypothetical protein